MYKTHSHYASPGCLMENYMEIKMGHLVINTQVKHSYITLAVLKVL